jgi:hypothetical protein
MKISITTLPPHHCIDYTANEGLARSQCLVPIYEFPEMKLRGLVISKTELYCSGSNNYFQDRCAYFTSTKYSR